MTLPGSGGRRHVHLDAVGGIAGDMFAAALLDAQPEHEAACLRAAEMVAHVPCRLLRHHDSVLAGARFQVLDDPAHGHHHHHHAAWHDIRARLQQSALPEPVRRHAIGIFAALAEAEAHVHGIEPEAVTFHEVGAVDSIADITAAAWLIAALAQGGADASWSVGPLPLGGGQVRTAHGVLPVPAPATALLLTGFAVHDDGIGGERVTPTGAAILRYLGAQHPPPSGTRRMLATGIGFGTRKLPGLPNMLRVLIGETASASAAATTHGQRALSVICFEVDDQTAEDLATGLDRIRALDGVLDALQMPAFGKKGRMATHVQVLVTPAAVEQAVEACFRETATIGLRVQQAEGRVLRRSMVSLELDGKTMRIKRAERPDGVTAKLEADDAAHGHGHAERQQLRHRAERDGL